MSANRVILVACLGLVVLVCLTTGEQPLAASQASVADADGGGASGWVRVEDEETVLSHAYAFRFEDCPGERGTVVVLSNTPLDVATLATPLDDEGAICDAAEQAIGDPGEAVACIVLFGDDRPHIWFARFQSGGMDGFTGPAYGNPLAPQLTTHTEQRIEGKWTTPEPQDFSGTPYSFDLEFAVDISDVAVTGEPLRTKAGEPGKVFRRYLKHVAEGDLEGIRAIARDNIAVLPEPGSEPQEIESTLSYLRMFAPQKAEIVGGTVAGDRALVAWEGQTTAGSTTGLARMKRDGDTWVLEHLRPCIRIGK